MPAQRFLKAGALLYDAAKYGPYADFIQTNAPKDYYSTSKGRFCNGIDDGGVKNWALDGFDGIFPNGYLPWMWCSGAETEGAYNWLKSYVQTDGSIKIGTDPTYALSVSIYGMAAANLKHVQPTTSFQWLNKTPTSGPFDNISGGVHDTPKNSDSMYDNVAGFSLMALMGWTPGFSCLITSLPNYVEEEKTSVKIISNPVSDIMQFILSNAYTGKVNIVLSDINGKLIRTISDNVMETGKLFSIDMKGLENAMYFLTIQDENGGIRECKKIIVMQSY